MVWYFIGVSIIKQNITLQNFSSGVEKYFTLLLHSLVKYYSTLKRNFISPCGHVIYFIYNHYLATRNMMTVS